MVDQSPGAQGPRLIHFLLNCTIECVVPDVCIEARLHQNLAWVDKLTLSLLWLVCNRDLPLLLHFLDFGL